MAYSSLFLETVDDLDAVACLGSTKSVAVDENSNTDNRREVDDEEVGMTWCVTLRVVYEEVIETNARERMRDKNDEDVTTVRSTVGTVLRATPRYDSYALSV
jgi:hypothetical protein